MQKKSFIPHVDLEGMRKAVNKVNTWLSDVFTRFARRKLTVQTEVKGSEKVEEVKRKVESLPKTQTVKMKVEKSGDYPEFQVSSHKSQVLRALNGRCWQ